VEKKDLPVLGNGIDYRPFWEQEKFRKDAEQLKKNLDLANRLLAERNLDPELNRFLGHALKSKAIRDGRLNFHMEAPFLNSDRYFLGLQYKF